MYEVFVVTGLELGWDCVVAVYNTNSLCVNLEELELQYPVGEFVITRTTVRNFIEND